MKEKEKSKNLITDWETNPSMSEAQRDKSQRIEEKYLRKIFNKQIHNLKPNKFFTKKTFFLNDCVYIVIEETEDELVGQRGDEIVRIKKGK